MEKNPSERGVNPQDQFNQHGQAEPQAGSAYQVAKYRLVIGTHALRAAERLTQGLGTTNGARDEASPTGQQDGAESERQVMANVYCDPQRHTVSLLLDEATANTVMYAVRLFAAESEAHAREVRMVRATLPPDSYGAANRHVIAMRHERIAARLRVLEGNYRAVRE